MPAYPSLTWWIELTLSIDVAILLFHSPPLVALHRVVRGRNARVERPRHVTESAYSLAQSRDTKRWQRLRTASTTEEDHQLELVRVSRRRGRIISSASARIMRTSSLLISVKHGLTDEPSALARSSRCRLLCGPSRNHPPLSSSCRWTGGGRRRSPNRRCRQAGLCRELQLLLTKVLWLCCGCRH